MSNAHTSAFEETHSDAVKLINAKSTYPLKTLKTYRRLWGRCILEKMNKMKNLRDSCNYNKIMAYYAYYFCSM